MMDPRILAMPDEDDDEDKRAPILSWTDQERIFALAIHPGGHLISGGDPNGDITLWDSRTGTKEYTLSGHSESVLALLVVPEINALFSAGADSTVRLWNMDSLQNTMVFEGHRGFVVGLWATCGESGTGLFSGSDDRTIKQWNTHSGACVHSYRGHKGPVNVIAGNDTHIFSGSTDGLLKVWELSTRRCIRTVEAHRDSIWALVVLDDGRCISGSTDSSIKVWEDLVHSTNLVSELNGHRGKIRKMVSQGPILFSGGADSVIHVWNLNSYSLVSSLRYHTKQVSGLTLHNNQLCSCGFDRQLARWDVSDLLPVKHKIEPFQPLAAVRQKELALAREKFSEINYLRNKQQMKDKTPDEITAMYKELPVNFVVDALEFKVASSRLATEVLFYVPFLLCFVFIFMVNRPIEDNFYMVHGIGSLITTEQLPCFKLPRTFYDVTSTAWFYTWLQLAITELWMDRKPNGYPSIQGQNYLIGAMRIRTQRVDAYSCEFNSYLLENETGLTDLAGPGGGVPCYARLNMAPPTTDPFLCPPTSPGCSNDTDALDLLNVTLEKGFEYSEDYGSTVVGQLQTYNPGGYAIDFFFNESIDKQFAKANAMKKLGFIDDVATRMVEVAFYAYNPAIDIFLGVQHLFEVPIGGSWISITREVGFEVFTLKNTTVLVFEFIFFVLVLVFGVLLFLEAREERRKKRLLGFFLNVWTWMEIATFVIFLVMYSYRWSWMELSTSVDLSTILDSETYSSQLEKSLVYFQLQIWLIAVNTILIFMKLLKYVRLNDRLNILTRTLAACQQSLIGVLILFVYVVFGFAITANALYGNTLFQFRTIDAAYVSLLRALLGDFDYQGMSSEARAATVIFFWAYQILCLFILLNFLVAVISDGFADVSHARSSIPLDQSIIKVFQDAKYQCLPKTLKMQWLLFKHRQSQTSVVRDTLEKIMEKRLAMVDAEAAQRQDFDELEHTMMHKDDFIAQLPEESKNYINEEFIEEVWKDMAWEYHHQKLAQRGQEEQEKEQLVHEEVQQALRALTNAFPIIDTIRMRLENEEAKLRPFASTLGVAF